MSDRQWPEFQEKIQDLLSRFAASAFGLSMMLVVGATWGASFEDSFFGRGLAVTPAEAAISGLEDRRYFEAQIAPADAAVEEAAAAFARERECLAQAIYFEARSEGHEGQVAVAEVVLNRVANARYPDTICGVVFQGEHRRNSCQFSFACDGLSDKAKNKVAWKKAARLADEVLSGRQTRRVAGEATHYHADYVAPYWAQHLEPVGQIGRHIFYREPSQAENS